MAEANKKEDNQLGRVTTLGIRELFETLFCLPKDYDDFHKLIGKDDIEANAGRRVNLVVKTLSAPRQAAHKQQPRYSISVTNGKHRLTLSDFGYLKQSAWAEVKEGEILFVQADIHVFSDRFYLSKPMLIPTESRGRLAPRYAGKPGVLKGETVRERLRKRCRMKTLTAWPLNPSNAGWAAWTSRRLLPVPVSNMEALQPC